jgi:predicted permease
MTLAVFYKLLAIFATVLMGWLAGRLGWIGGKTTTGGGLPAAARAISDATFYLFVPALLFRTMAHLDFASLPWRTAAAFFVPVVVVTVAVYLWRRSQRVAGDPAAPAALTVIAIYGNAVQLGIPMAAALFGEQGLALHVALVSLHGVLLLTLLTVLAELDIARADREATLAATVRITVRNAVLHPVTLPVLLGVAWNATGGGLHPVVDEALAVLGAAVVPVCLVLIGLNLAQYGLRGQWRASLGFSAVKLLLMPAAVLVVAHGAFGLSGTPLAVIVIMAALPTGSNALIFAQRYGTQQAQATATIVVTTVGFVASASVWLVVLALLERWAA